MGLAGSSNSDETAQLKQQRLAMHRATHTASRHHPEFLKNNHFSYHEGNEFGKVKLTSSR
jgi:hypothetical protein